MRRDEDVLIKRYFNGSHCLLVVYPLPYSRTLPNSIIYKSSLFSFNGHTVHSPIFLSKCLLLEKSQ